MTFKSQGGSLNVSRLAAIAEAAPCPACAIKAELESLTARGGYSKSTALAKSPRIRELFVHECADAAKRAPHEPRRTVKNERRSTTLETATDKGETVTKQEPKDARPEATVHYEAKKNRQTGTRIIVWKTSSDKKEYRIECVDHGAEHVVGTVGETKIATTPSIWCDDCSRQVAAENKAAKQDATTDEQRAVMAS
jgi:hypothetical protein